MVPRYRASPSASGDDGKQTADWPGSVRSSQTSVDARCCAFDVCAVVSVGGLTTASAAVENTVASASSRAVDTSVPSGMRTTRSAGEDSQNVRFARATLGGNGSMPTRLRKCTYMRSGTWLTR